MRLLSIVFERYKPFKEKREIHFAPTNILIGKNGGGKSALCRLMLLLARAVSDDPNGTLDLTAGDVEHGVAFDDLIYERSALPFTLGIQVGDAKSTCGVETNIRYVAERRELVVERCAITHNGASLFVLELKDLADLIADRRIYTLLVPGKPPAEHNQSFSGILPSITQSPWLTEYGDVLAQFPVALPMPSYLGPFREEPKDVLRTPSTAIRGLGARGERALELLADDKIRHGGILTKDVTDWFESNFEGQSFEVDVSARLPRALMKDKSAGIDVALNNTGAGFSQALPIVVQNFAIRHHRINTNILIVEQPELHLHPAAHGAMADLFMNTTKPRSDFLAPICFVETHSEQFLMRIRRRIAEGRDHRDFALFSFGHVDHADGQIGIPIKMINFDKSGDPESWPLGVFEETFDDLTKLRQANINGNVDENTHT